MKTTVLFVTGLCLIAAGCKKTPPAVAGNTQIQTPVEAPTPPPQQAKQQVAAAPKQAAPGQPAAPKSEPPKRLSGPERAALNDLLAKLSDAFFNYNEANIRPDAAATMAANVTAVRNILADYPAEKLLIEGHADERGSSEYNLALADRRSRAAQEFLSTRGIPPNQLNVLSFGEERPACREQTEACYQQNRRVHITVAP